MDKTHASVIASHSDTHIDPQKIQHFKPNTVSQYLVKDNGWESVLQTGRESPTETINGVFNGFIFNVAVWIQF